jgi:hypothetical protein
MQNTQDLSVFTYILSELINHPQGTGHSRDLCGIVNREIALVGEVLMLSTRFDNLN